MILNERSNLTSINNMGYLICENSTPAVKPQDIQHLANGTIRIKVKLQDADVINRNGRLYELEAIKQGLMSEYVQERLATYTWYGEAGHPMKPDVQRQLHIDQRNISHIIHSIWWEGNVLWGYVDSAPTACGDDFKRLILAGSKVAFSLRAVGPVVVQAGDHVVVKSPLTVFTFDWVVHPSHKIAYMQEIVGAGGNLSESTNLFTENANLFIPYSTGDAIEYLKESTKLNLITEQFAVSNFKNVSINKDASKIIINEGTNPVTMNFSKFAKEELNSYLSSF